MKDFLLQYRKLNKEQRQAVDSLEGPVMVIAGPGTGKTQVLALRIVNILRKKKARGEEILALTFSQSAAVSMQKRVAEFIGPLAYEVAIKTFHGFCNDLILDNPQRFAFTKDLKQLDELGAVKRIKGILRRGKFRHLKPFFDPFYYQREILAKVGELKREGVLPEELKSALERSRKALEERKKINPRTGKPTGEWQKQATQQERLEDLLRIYVEYLRLNKEKGEYDFSDMVIWVVEKLKSDRELREEYQEKFKYILSDEYQDTNIPQNEVVRILGNKEGQGGKEPNVFVVGDDDQAIYRFQGASLGNILAFEKAYPAAKIISINVNYRSNQGIVEAAKALIGKNKERLVNKSGQKVNKDSRSFSGKSEKRTVQVFEFSEKEVEDFFIAEKIKELSDKGMSLKEMAVICRTNREVEEIADYLMKAGISVEIWGTGSVLDKLEVKEVGKILKLVRNPRDSVLAFEVMSQEIWGIEPRDFLKFCFEAGRERISYLEYFLEKEKARKREKGWQDFSKIEAFFSKILAWHKLSASLPVALLLERVLNEGGLVGDYVNKKDLRGLNRLTSFFRFVRERNRKDPELKLARFLKDLEIMIEDKISVKEKELSMAENDVRLLTAHAAKGREFEAVFIPRLYRGVWDGKRVYELIKLPWDFLETEKRDVQKTEKEEEERRLFFVALTRAKKQVFLSRAQSYDYLGDSKERAPSKFLLEMGKDWVEEGEIKGYEDKVLERGRRELGGESKKDFKEEERQGFERDFLKKRVEDLSLNPTSLNLYLSCPRRYKYEKLFLVPKIKTKTLSLGTAVHKALEDFFGAFLRGKAAAGEDFLLKAFRRALEKEILSGEDFKAIQEEGEKLLKGYYKEYRDRLVRPVALETGFFRVYLEDVLLKGTVDKIEPLGKAGNLGGREKPLVKVVDYKTGRAKTRNEILGKTKNAKGDIYRQLVFYKLLSLMDKKFPYKVGEAEVDFIKPERGKFRKESFQITEKEVADLKKLIKKVAGQIRKLEFRETRDKRECEWCDLKDICGKKKRNF